MKILIKSKIESLNETKSFESTAIKDLNKLKYMEDDVLVVLEKKENEVILKRSTKDFKYKFIFKGKKSTLDYNLSAHNVNFKLNFITDKLEYNDNKIFVQYTLEGVKYTYEVIVKEEV